jgi:hypothetical protein
MISLLLALVAHADEVPVDSRVDAVTVFMGQARVTRVASARVPAGRSELVFDGLPMGLDPAALSASGTGDATLLGVDLRTDYGAVDHDEELRALRAQERATQAKIDEQRDIVARVTADLTFLQALQPKVAPELDAELFLEDTAAAELATLARTLQTSSRDLLREQRTAERAMRDLQAELERIAREISMIGADTRDTTRVAVGIDAPRGGTVTVSLSYLVEGASWTPRYDARYDLTSSRVRMDLSGVVSQSTGEDWAEARLTLSNAPALRGTQPPELSPFYLYEGYNGAPGQIAGAGGGTTEFVASRTATVPSDGSQHTVPLRSVTVAATTEHHTVPRRAPVAYLTAKVTNEGDWAWLPGPVNAFLGTAFVGSGNLAQTAPGSEASVSFGVDDRVAVERVRVEDLSLGQRALSNRDRRTWGFETRVTNGTPGPISLVVVEQVPTTREARYEIETKVVPEVTVPKEGVFEWNATLQPRERGVYRLEYDVSWPQGDQPVLLD